MNISSSQWIGIFVRLGLLVLIGVAAFYVLSFTLPLLYPFLIGWLIAMAIEPAVRFLERKLRLPRWAGVSLMLIIVLAVVSSLLVLLITQVVVELTRLAEFCRQVSDGSTNISSTCSSMKTPEYRI